MLCLWSLDFGEGKQCLQQRLYEAEVPRGGIRD